jgi:hypothetical protein
MNFDAMADSNMVIESDARVNAAILANPTARTNYGMCADLRPRADVRVL